MMGLSDESSLNVLLRRHEWSKVTLLENMGVSKSHVRISGFCTRTRVITQEKEKGYKLWKESVGWLGSERCQHHCNFTLILCLPLGSTSRTAPFWRNGFNTSGFAHSSSHPFSIAKTEYLPGTMSFKMNVPSLSL
jgi:hypothetical protein